MTYTQKQIQGVRDMQRAHKIPGILTDDACIEFLNWYMKTQSIEARGLKTELQEIAFGLVEGSQRIDQQKQKLTELAGRA